MSLNLIGPHPFAKDAQGQLLTRIGTLFPDHSVLYTEAPAIHACQRMAYIEQVNAGRAANGIAALSLEEEDQLCSRSVDLILEEDHILIRPNADQMDLAFAADECLQTLISKRAVRFLSVGDSRVREAIKRRGECWRLSTIPKTAEEKKRLVFSSRVGIQGLPIYFYNRLTGTRWLTFEAFSNLEKLDDPTLAAHLREISDHSIHRNRMGRPELDFFAADLRRFGAHAFAGVNYEQLSHDELRSKFATLRDHFSSAVHESFRKDDCDNKAWAERILSTLFLEGNEAQTEQILSGLSPEFYLQIEWLPGGRFEEGEFIFDTIFEEAAAHPEDAALQKLCDPRSKGVIFNLIRDYGDLEYINVGTVPESLSLARPERRARRGVFIAELQSRSEPRPIKRFARLQKWGVWEHLDEGKPLLQSVEESDEYTDYWQDRRLGCRQLGMKLTRRVIMRRLRELYQGKNERYRGQIIHTTYFEREYLTGVATDKVPLESYSRPGYALKLAYLLGQAGATSMIVGRALEEGTRPVFDDGDEVVRDDESGLPCEILIGDHSGAFGEYTMPFEHFVDHYAKPVNIRAKYVPEPEQFAETYLAAFREQFLHVQGDYRKRRRAFDTLFKHLHYDPAGSFAYRWECVLRRLDQADVEKLVTAIREKIWILNRKPAEDNIIRMPVTVPESAKALPAERS
jgi:hypothetical protein